MRGAWEKAFEETAIIENRRAIIFVFGLPYSRVERVTVRLNINALVTRLTSFININEFERTLFYPVTVREKQLVPYLRNDRNEKFFGENVCHVYVNVYRPTRSSFGKLSEWNADVAVTIEFAQTGIRK